MKLLLSILCVGALMLAGGSRAAADTYNFTMGGPGYTYGANNANYPVGTPFGIPGIAGTTGDFNQINDYAGSTSSFSNEVDASGSDAAGVGITLTNFQSNDSAYQQYTTMNGDNNFDSGLFGHFDYNHPPNDGGTATQTVTLTNLDANSEYEVLLYGYNGNGPTGGEGRNDEVEAAGSNTTYILEDTSYDGFLSTLDTTNSTATTKDYIGNYLTLDATTDGSGNLVLNFTGIPNTYQTNDLSGIQVTNIPEPSTWAMMLGGLAALGWMARRRLAS